MKSDLITYEGGRRTLYLWDGPDRLLVNGRERDLAGLGVSASTVTILEKERPHLMGPGRIMWHLTRDVDGVMASGLELRTPKLIENPRGVYLFASCKRAIQAQRECCDPLVLLEVDVSDLQLRPDRMIQGAWRSCEAIDLARIAVVGTAVDAVAHL